MNVPYTVDDLVVGPRGERCRDYRAGRVLVPTVGVLGHDPLERSWNGRHRNAPVKPWGSAKCFRRCCDPSWWREECCDPRMEFR
eukprot:304543-Alexandrium_andersonii.AAC.1